MKPNNEINFLESTVYKSKIKVDLLGVEMKLKKD